MNDSKPVDHRFEAAKNRVKALVYQWMSVWDANRGDAAPLLDLLSPEGISIELVEEKETIDTIAGVKAWFARFPTLVESDNHIVESIEVQPTDDPMAYRVQTQIRGPGVGVDGKPFLVFSRHDWEVVDYGGFMPRIRKMQVRLIRES